MAIVRGAAPVSLDAGRARRAHVESAAPPPAAKLSGDLPASRTSRQCVVDALQLRVVHLIRNVHFGFLPSGWCPDGENHSQGTPGTE